MFDQSAHVARKSTFPPAAGSVCLLFIPFPVPFPSPFLLLITQGMSPEYICALYPWEAKTKSAQCMAETVDKEFCV